jgi:hypothetical protein
MWFDTVLFVRGLEQCYVARLWIGVVDGKIRMKDRFVSIGKGGGLCVCTIVLNNSEKDVRGGWWDICI